MKLKAKHARVVASAMAMAMAMIFAACGGSDDKDPAPPQAPEASSQASLSSSSDSSASSDSSSSSASSLSSSASSSSISLSTPFNAADLDADGWFWFSNPNAANYLVGEGADCAGACWLDPDATVNAGEFIFVHANLISVAGIWSSSHLVSQDQGVTFTRSGPLNIPFASSAGALDGGSVVFKLPSLSSFLLFSAVESSGLYYAVDVSHDGGQNWVEVHSTGSTSETKAYESTIDIGAYTGRSLTPVSVRIRNLKNDFIYVMGVRIGL